MSIISPRLHGIPRVIHVQRNPRVFQVCSQSVTNMHHTHTLQVTDAFDSVVGFPDLSIMSTV